MANQHGQLFLDFWNFFFWGGGEGLVVWLAFLKVESCSVNIGLLAIWMAITNAHEMYAVCRYFMRFNHILEIAPQIKGCAVAPKE